MRRQCVILSGSAAVLGRLRRGSVAVSFLLTFPIFLILIAIIVQYALMLNARIMVEHAAQVAARSAATCLPDEQPDRVRRAAIMTLAPLSPKLDAPAGDEGQATADALQSCGVNVPESFASRYSYTMDATRVWWTGGDFLHEEGRPIEVWVQYRFLLTVPGASRIIASQDTVSGVKGRFWTIRAKTMVQSSHGRRTHAHGDGWPW